MRFHGVRAKCAACNFSNRRCSSLIQPYLTAHHRIGSRMLLQMLLAAVADPGAVLEVLRDALLSGQEAGMTVVPLRSGSRRAQVSPEAEHRSVSICQAAA